MRPSTRRLFRAALQWIVLPVVLAGGIGFVMIGVSRWPTGSAVGGALKRPASQSATRPTSLRIASFNIHSARDEANRPSLDQIVELVRGYDVVGLQETRGSYSGDPQATEIAKRINADSIFAPTEWTGFHDDFGNALLTRVPLESWQRIPLPGTQWSHYRNVLMTTTTIGDTPVRVLVTHVDRQTDRAAQLQFLWQLFSSLQPPCVIVGDFNTTLDDPLLAPFRTGGINALDDRGGPARIDHIFTRGLRVTDAGVVENKASDHPLVWTEVEVDGAK